MNRNEVLQKLSEHRQVLREMGVRSLALFGSVARGEFQEGSDIDLLAEFAEPPGFDGYMRVKFYLEELLGLPVDLVMVGALKPWARQTVLEEAIDVT